MIIDFYPSYSFKIFAIHLKILIRGSHLPHAKHISQEGYILYDLPVFVMC